ncbi:MAG: hypothetical protein Q9160_000133 [Pyrenula sp. 1 TL-2023]
MHYAFPPRKDSSKPPYAIRSRPTSPIHRRIQLLGTLAAAILITYLSWTYLFSSDSSVRVPAGTPPVVFVTVFDEEHSPADYVKKIQANREDYALRHGYRNFFANTKSYANYTQNAPDSWTLVPAVRDAMTQNPHSTFFFALTSHALIMQPSLSLHDHILKPAQLEDLMIKDIPVVPPDSVIHTFSHLKGDKVDLILTQDYENLSPGSFIIRQGDWAHYFLDAWFDPLYRAYNFQKAEGHALEHIVQWHPTILAKLALIPQRRMNAYNLNNKKVDNEKDVKEKSIYHEGDFLVRFFECDDAGDRNCAKELDPFYALWEKEVEALGGVKRAKRKDER